MSELKLTRSQVEKSLSKLQDELGKADFKRHQQLLPLINGASLNYADALNTLFPDQDTPKAQESFRSFRNRVNSAADEAKVVFQLEVDNQKRSDASERVCWFSGEDSTVEDIERYSAEETHLKPEEPLLASRAIPTESKRLIKLFISYAHRDDVQVKKFLDQLKLHFNVSKKYRYELWGDWEIVLGEDWDATIKEALNTHDFGLLLVSLSFLNSQYISKFELPQFLASGKAIPVGLSPIDFQNHDLKGLQDIQIFRLDDKFYSDYRKPKNEAFIAALFKAIEASLDKTLKKNAKPLAPDSCLSGLETFTQWAADKDFDPNYTATKGHVTQIRDVQNLLEREQKTEEGVIATDYLMDWLKQEHSPPFCALLGEYGMGKTTTCKALTRELLAERATNKALPLPIYIDLREYTWDKRVDFTLSEILEHILKKSWKGGHEDVGIKPADMIQQMQNHKALIIWDGLDEVIVHMPPKQASDFIRQLWRILPPLKQDKTQHPNAGKMLISCRSHYFRSIQEQNAMLTSEHRDGIKGEDYQALVLLPFTEAQIETYLQKSLKLDDAALNEVLDLIRSVHNLPEMAERPYTLSLIAQHIPDIEQLAMRGEPIQGVMLYQSMVEHWLRRDDGKHQFSPQHKKQLMEYLAAALWKSGQRQWNVDELDTWLDEFLFKNIKLASAYQNLDRNVLKEDLRTATFIVRPDENSFRFAHSSLQEFFLAAYMQRGLLTQERSYWQFETTPSPETLEFLTQLILIERSKHASYEKSLAAWLADYEPTSSRLVLQIWLKLAERGLVFQYQRMDLAGIDLFQWKIQGTAAQSLKLHDINWRSARLDQVQFKYIEFQRCDFTEAQGWLAEFQHCRFQACVFQKTNLMASIWRLNDLNDLDVSSCELSHSQWIRNSGAAWGADFPLAPNQRTTDKLPAKVWAQIQAGHTNAINAIAFSPDGSTIATASWDHTAALWDARSGERRLTFQHDQKVTAVALSPDGSSLATASYDHTAALWDARSGERRLVLLHENLVRAVAFSPDGSTLAIASDNHTAALWDVRSGERQLIFKHNKIFLSVVFSPDGSNLATTSWDDTASLWDARSGELQLTFKHNLGINVVAFSPNGTTLATASKDNTAALWDARSGERQLTLKHDKEVSALAFSPNSSTLATASKDKTVILWDACSGERRLILKHERIVRAVTFSPDGSTLATASKDKIVTLWDARSGERRLTLKHDSIVRAVAFSPDGSNLATASKDNTVTLWDNRSSERRLTLKHDSIVRAVAFSPDGRILVTASGNITQYWDLKTGECLATLAQHRNQQYSMIKQDRITHASPDAWRYLRYVEELENGERILHPAEIFGALAGSE
ncbi:MAG: TIR domain-containing protein [Thiothrix sp.]|nr:MAG: TIR domain-containing protein [Thiothrix sp.]